MMFSEASKIYDRSHRVKPLNKKDRLNIYNSKSVTVQKKNGQSKFSPFNTVSRQSRNSYLLRVTKQTTTNTNYTLNHSTIIPLARRPTIDKAAFARIVGPSAIQDYSIQINPQKMPSRCLHSLTISPQSKRPLTVRDQHKWRKTFQHFDFTKQQSTKRLQLQQKLSLEQSTNTSFMNSLKGITQSNFNNFQRFKMKQKKISIHSFQSDFGHQYLKNIQDAEKLPQYDILPTNQQFIRPSMAKPKGFVQFDQYRQKIRTRVDRFDPQWNKKLEYDQTPLEKRTQDKHVKFDNQLDRMPNDVYSKYPIRISLETINRIKGL